MASWWDEALLQSLISAYGKGAGTNLAGGKGLNTGKLRFYLNKCCSSSSADCVRPDQDGGLAVRGEALAMRQPLQV